MNKFLQNPIVQVITIFLTGALIILGTNFVVSKVHEPQIIEKEIVREKIVTSLDCPKTYEAYLNLVSNGQVIKLASNLNSYAINSKFINSKTITLIRSGKSQIACGYLYINASVNNKKLDDKFDSIYINPQGFGGHILRTRGISFNPNITSLSEVLIPLNSISYLPNLPYNPNAQDYYVSDWVKLLNVGNRLSIDLALSTQNQKGVIEDISIAYKCWNPNTGEETTDCQLGITK
ncbi:MAG: hypothetical protein HY918_02775 [Candidatus Doudnabacteria bacterium]|nr:hypothetical protein [Candidatus Doudnabacteria bacterium]